MLMLKFKYRSPASNHGLSLLEVMIALLLALLLVTSLVECVVTVFNNLRLIAMINEVERKAHITFNIIEQVLHQVGYIGCPKLQKKFPSNLNFIPLVAKRHSFSVAYMDSHVASLKSPPNGKYVYIDKMIHLQKKDPVIIADCEAVEKAFVGSVNQTAVLQKITMTQSLKHNFNSGAELGHFKFAHFFVAETKQTDKNGKKILALFISDLKARRNKLITGVSEFNLHYLGLKNGRIILLDNYDHLAWDKIVAVDVELQLTSPLSTHVFRKFVTLGN